jgi:mRNA interferase MazF
MNGIRAMMSLKSYVQPKDTQVKQGQLWLAKVYYRNPETGTLEEKERPIIVVGNDRTEDTNDVLVVPCTTQPPRSEFDVPLRFWRPIGLLRPTYARVAKIHQLRKDYLVQLISERLDYRDWLNIRDKLLDLF